MPIFWVFFHSADKTQVDRYKEEESKKQAAQEHRSMESKDEHTKNSSQHEHHRKRKHDYDRY